jgi:hypothetical protein
MESYQINFGPDNDSKKNLPASGDLFVYESAAAASTAETRIRVKPDSGAVIVLRPGQWFRNPNKVTGWALESFSGVDVITANVVIGYGEFGDANTLNKVTLDATFANVVTVANTPQNRVNVALDPNNVLSTSAPIMAYNLAKNMNLAAGYNAIATAAENVNGLIFEQVYCSGPCSLVAHPVQPTGAGQGDFLAVNNGSPAMITQRIKVAAGKGLWIYNGGAAVTAYVLVTML